MRWVIVLAIMNAGCSAILGIEDPVAGGDDVDGGSGELSFAPAAPVASAPLLRSLGAADVDGDGRLDVIGAVNTQSGTSTADTMISNGDGTLDDGPAIQGNSTVMAYANSVASADLDGEGFADYVISNAEGKDITVSDNLGSGVHYGSQSGGVGCAVGSVRIADFTEDGLLDVVAVTNCLAGIEVWAGTGGGALAASVQRSFTTSGTLQELVVADVNGDGHQDVVTAESYQLDVVLGTGGGMIAAAAPLTTPTQFPHMFQLADIDGDGDPDLVFPESDLDRIAVMRNNGDGTFAAVQETVTPTGPLAIAIADFDDDGHLDVAGTAPNSGNEIFVLPGNGDGTFGEARRFDVGAQALFQIMAIDLDEDLRPDLVLNDPWVVLLNTTD